MPQLSGTGCLQTSEYGAWTTNSPVPFLRRSASVVFPHHLYMKKSQEQLSPSLLARPTAAGHGRAPVAVSKCLCAKEPPCTIAVGMGPSISCIARSV